MRQYSRGKLEEIIMPTGDVSSPEREVETDLERPVCERHNPLFTPGVGVDGKPRKPVGLCPECSSEAAQRRSRTGSSAELVANPRSMNEPVFGQDVYRTSKALEAYQERLANRPGYVVPGSQDERRGLDLIDSKRDADRDAEDRKSGLGGRVCVERIENCRVVQYVAHKGIRGLVRREL